MTLPQADQDAEVKGTEASDRNQAQNPLAALEQRLARHQRFVLGLIIAVSLLVRVSYFLQLSSGPCIWQHQWAESDMAFFDSWARHIAAGDWLGREPLHPCHVWHVAVAEEYFKIHPEQAAAYGFSASSDTHRPAAIKLWNEWYGQTQFHQEPLYPYLLAVTYKVFGPDVRWVFLWQMLGGVGSVVLVYLLARRYFGVLPAAMAGLLAVLASPLLYYELILLREAFIILFTLLLAYLVTVSLDKASWKWWLLTGAVMGLALLLKSSFALFVGPAILVVALLNVRNPKALLRSVGPMIGGIVLLLIPLLARNAAVGAPLLSSSSVGPVTFVTSNTAEYRAQYGFDIEPHEIADIMGRSQGRFGPAMKLTLATHMVPASYIDLIGRKFALAWSWYEMPLNENFYYYRMHADILKLPGTFAILGSLGAIGMILALPKLRQAWPLYLALFSTLLTMLIFYVLSRFRAPMTAALIPFAGFAVIQIYTWIGQRRLRPFAATAVGLVAVFVLINYYARPDHSSLIRPQDFYAPLEFYYMPRAQQAVQAGHYDQACQIYEAALANEPPVATILSEKLLPHTRDDVRIAGDFAPVHAAYAKALAQAGRAAQAAKETLRAEQLTRAQQLGSRLGLP